MANKSVPVLLHEALTAYNSGQYFSNFSISQPKNYGQIGLPALYLWKQEYSKDLSNKEKVSIITGFLEKKIKKLYDELPNKTINDFSNENLLVEISLIKKAKKFI